MPADSKNIGSARPARRQGPETIRMAATRPETAMGSDLDAQGGLLQVLNKTDKAFGLFFETIKEFSTGETAGSVEEAVDLRKKNAFGINVGVAVGEDLHELFGGAECAPDAGGE